MEICIDFDGTCVTHEFPKVGKDIGAVPVLKKLVEAGHKLILFTMRSDRPNHTGQLREDIKDVTGIFLTDAIDWFNKNQIPLYGINSNPNQGWTTSPKAYAHLYIDDAALGCPLLFIPEMADRPFADWNKIEEILIEMKIL